MGLQAPDILHGRSKPRVRCPCAATLYVLFQTTETMKKQVVLDTETTGLNPGLGHRIIEVAAVVLIDRKPTDTFHVQIDPQRAIDEEARRVHHIDAEQLKGKPLFADVCDKLLNFVRDSQLIIHNAAFDLGFLDAEFERMQRKPFVEESGCDVVDTMDLATEINPGMRKSLDALCDYYKIDRSKRDKGHNAVLDAELLASVYLAMTGGQISMDLQREEMEAADELDGEACLHGDSRVLPAGPEELRLHEQFLAMIEEKSDAKKPSSF